MQQNSWQERTTLLRHRPLKHLTVSTITLFGLIAVGQLLRASGALPTSASGTLGGVILKVTMPALIVTILGDARFESALVPAVLATTVAQLVALALGVLLLRALGASRVDT